MANWPNKEDRQQIELDILLRDYPKLEYGGEIELVRWRERPDCEVRALKTGQLFGLELTSVYLNKRRVEKYRKGLVKVPKRDPGLLEAYQARLLKAVREKVELARSGYEIYPRMLLGIFVGDVVAIHLDHEADWRRFHEKHRSDLEQVSPFSEVVFFNLANSMICQVFK